MGKGAKSVSKAATYHKYSLITLGAAPLGRALFLKGFQSALNVANSPPLDFSYTVCRVEVIVLLLTTLGATDLYTSLSASQCKRLPGQEPYLHNVQILYTYEFYELCFSFWIIILEFCVLVRMPWFSPYFHLYVR